MTLKTCKTVTDNNLALTNKQNKLTLSNQYVVGFFKFIVLIFCVLSLFNHKHIISEYNKNVTLNYILKYPLRIQKLLRKNLSIDFGNYKTQLSHKLIMFLFQNKLNYLSNPFHEFCTLPQHFANSTQQYAT